jgi:hypothetical protein
MSLSIGEVYNKIAVEFDITRVRIWGSVKKFLLLILKMVVEMVKICYIVQN